MLYIYAILCLFGVMEMLPFMEGWFAIQTIFSILTASIGSIGLYVYVFSKTDPENRPPFGLELVYTVIYNFRIAIFFITDGDLMKSKNYRQQKTNLLS